MYIKFRIRIETIFLKIIYLQLRNLSNAFAGYDTKTNAWFLTYMMLLWTTMHEARGSVPKF